jgi:hypothetical protein
LQKGIDTVLDALQLALRLVRQPLAILQNSLTQALEHPTELRQRTLQQEAWRLCTNRYIQPHSQRKLVPHQPIEGDMAKEG